MLKGKAWLWRCLFGMIFVIFVIRRVGVFCVWLVYASVGVHTALWPKKNLPPETRYCLFRCVQVGNPSMQMHVFHHPQQRIALLRSHRGPSTHMSLSPLTPPSAPPSSHPPPARGSTRLPWRHTPDTVPAALAYRIHLLRTFCAQGR